MTARNDHTGDAIRTRHSKEFEENFDRIFRSIPPLRPRGPDTVAAEGGRPAPYVCRFCGAPSYYAPEDQEPPPDYCHESDHGGPGA